MPSLSALADTPPRALAGKLKPASWAEMPGWSNDDLSQFWPLFIRNCRGLMRPTSGNLARATPRAWQPVCAAADPARAGGGRRRGVRRFLQTYLQPWRLNAADGKPATNTVTGYYEPLVRGSRRQGGAYQWPLYTVPADLLTIDLGSVYPELAGKRVRGKLDGKRVVPYDTRAAIEASGRRPPVLVWVDDPVDNFFLQVQGSGRVLLTDGPDSGKTIRVAYADHNGQPYASIGRWLIDRGELSADQASMQNIRAWAQRNPKRVPEMLNANPAVVFFREEAVVDPEQGPKGAYGIAWRRSVRWRWTPVSCLWARRCSWPPRIPRPTGRCSGWCSPGHRHRHPRRGAGRLLLGLRRGSRAAGGPHEAARPDVAAVAQTGRGAQRAMTHQIVVCGAGIVGLSTALALARRGQRVAVLARAPRCRRPKPTTTTRAFTRSPRPASGSWPAWASGTPCPPPADAGTGHGDLRRRRRRGPSQRLAGGAAALAWIVESGEIERVLIQAVRLFGIPWIEDRCAGYANGEIQTENGARIRAELFVGADGAASPLREAAGLKHEAVPYKDTGLVVHLDAERPHQGTAVQWFRDDGVLALLPLPDTSDGAQVSMVWSMREEAAARLLACRRASRPPRWKDCWRTRPRAGWAS